MKIWIPICLGDCHIKLCQLGLSGFYEIWTSRNVICNSSSDSDSGMN